ncbi:MAG: tRNA-dihydrouridine synthase [Candidatus Saccharimonadales bacterium]
MDDVTDTVFRQIISGCTPPDMCFTEFVNVDGLQSPGRPKLLKKLKFVSSEPSLVAQLWGKNPDNFYKTAYQIADGTFARELGLTGNENFAGVDLNMGCPQKTEIKNGTCSALINNRPLAEEIIKATKAGLDGKLPLSVKTRTGYNSVDLSWIEFLLNKQLNMLTIHGRTKAQMSRVPANWDIIGEVVGLRDKLSPKTLIVGNGDVLTRQQGEELAKRYNLDGIMIGRGVFQDPYIFSSQNLWQGATPETRIKLYRKHIQLFADTWQDGQRPVNTLNKFCKIYINGFDGAKELREKLMVCRTTDELLKLL